jgi:hypothetical protein
MPGKQAIQPNGRKIKVSIMANIGGFLVTLLNRLYTPFIFACQL